jgi:hypothetical protein
MKNPLKIRIFKSQAHGDIDLLVWRGMTLYVQNIYHICDIDEKFLYLHVRLVEILFISNSNHSYTQDILEQICFLLRYFHRYFQQQLQRHLPCILRMMVVL